MLGARSYWMADPDDTSRVNAPPKEPPACGRCTWLKGGGNGEEIPDHSAACPFRDSGKDAEPDGP
jgi:hypothetical protein